MAWAGAVGADDLPRPIVDDDYLPVSEAEARLGQLLFYDRVLSGNRNIACSTCHHPRFGTSDGLSLGLGEGGKGLGPDRVPDPANLPEQLIPRNSPALFNLGHRDIRVMFHDGRIETDDSLPSGFRTPLGEDMAAGFSGLLSAQTMFPVLSADEMAGHYGENDISVAVRQGLITGPGGAWDLISDRVASIPEYARMFEAVYPEIAAGRPIGFTDISNAIAVFIAFEWRSDDSPFDAVLRGEADFSDAAAAGFALFSGQAGCIDCHSGPLLTDQRFHAMAEPQLGPGKAARFETHREDHGRFRVTGQAADLHAFRTPSLRNVSATGPWGHAGAFSDLADYLRHHADPSGGVATSPILPDLAAARPVFGLPDEQVEAIRAARVRPTRPLTKAEVAALMAFLDTLTDPTALYGRLGVPDAVPSGLPVDR